VDIYTKTFNILYLYQNPFLCYYVSYITWATVNDDPFLPRCSCNPCLNGGSCYKGTVTYQCSCPLGFLGSQCESDVDQCRSNPCVNGGICSNGVNAFTCTCTSTGFTGSTCEIYNPSSLACPVGQYKDTTSPGCLPCRPGSYRGPTDPDYVLCQAGTVSASEGAPSAESCQPCPLGSYAPNLGMTNCSACARCGTVGSLMATPISEGVPLPLLINATAFAQTKYDSSGNILTTGSANIDVGYYYLGIFLGVCFLSTVIIIPIRRRLRWIVSPLAAVLRAPLNYMRAVASTGKVVEVPSFYRGLVGIWVVLGLILVTGYQINVFVLQHLTTLSAV
jgi:hypothetical protein